MIEGFKTDEIRMDEYNFLPILNIKPNNSNRQTIDVFESKDQ